jgi:hypothetical protein
MPLSRKRGRDNFKQLVKDCTCPVNVLTKERIEKFALRARAHMCTYHHLEQQHQLAAPATATSTDKEDQNSSAAAPSVSPKQELLYTEIERLMKAFKGHRCALNFDRGFVNSELRNAKVEDTI